MIIELLRNVRRFVVYFYAFFLPGFVHVCVCVSIWAHLYLVHSAPIIRSILKLNGDFFNVEPLFLLPTDKYLWMFYYSAACWRTNNNEKKISWIKKSLTCKQSELYIRALMRFFCNSRCVTIALRTVFAKETAEHQKRFTIKGTAANGFSHKNVLLFLLRLLPVKKWLYNRHWLQNNNVFNIFVSWYVWATKDYTKQKCALKIKCKPSTTTTTKKKPLCVCALDCAMLTPLHLLLFLLQSQLKAMLNESCIPENSEKSNKRTFHFRSVFGCISRENVLFVAHFKVDSFFLLKSTSDKKKTEKNSHRCWHHPIEFGKNGNSSQMIDEIHILVMSIRKSMPLIENKKNFF